MSLGKGGSKESGKRLKLHSWGLRRSPSHQRIVFSFRFNVSYLVYSSLKLKLSLQAQISYKQPIANAIMVILMLTKVS